MTPDGSNRSESESTFYFRTICSQTDTQSAQGGLHRCGGVPLGRQQGILFATRLTGGQRNQEPLVTYIVDVPSVHHDLIPPVGGSNSRISRSFQRGTPLRHRIIARYLSWSHQARNAPEPGSNSRICRDAHCISTVQVEPAHCWPSRKAIVSRGNSPMVVSTVRPPAAS
jgi:hypothetical protein